MTAKDSANGGNRVRVSIVVSHLFPMLGMESATLSLAEALSRRYEVRISAIAGEAANIEGSSQISVESWGSRVLGWRRVITILRAFAHRKDLDGSVIILVGAWAAIPMLVALPARVRRRCLVWEHSFDDQKVDSDGTLVYLRSIARPMYARAGATIVVSDSLRSNLHSAGFRGKIEVIPNFTRNFNLVTATETIPGRLLSVGSLTRTKNQLLALQTLALLPTRYSLDILGDGPERENLQRSASELGVADRVNFCGHVSNPAHYFAQSEIVIHPSLGETYGLVLFEAAEFGRPVVAVNQSVMPETIPRYVPGLVAEPQAHTFAAGIRSLEDHPPTAEQVARAGQERRLLAENIGGDWERLIDAVSQ